MIHIKPSAAIRNNYNEISQLCKETEQPVYLTKNGEGDLVVMDIKSFSKRESMLKLREMLVEAEESRIRGNKSYTIEEVSNMMKKAIRGHAIQLFQHLTLCIHSSIF